jgi:hypothetical protein
MELTWDPQQIGMTAEEVGQQLLDGEPRIMSHAEGPGHSFLIRPVAMKEGEYRVVAERLLEVFRRAPKGQPPRPLRPAAVDLAGRWELKIDFVSGSVVHQCVLETKDNAINGKHAGRITKGDLTGTIDGERISFRSVLPYESARLVYEFNGTARASEMSGAVSFGEYGSGNWSAKKLGSV